MKKTSVDLRPVRPAHLAVLAAAAAALVGCSLLPKESQEDLISSSVSLSVIPWEDARPALLSTFQLTDARALEMVLPTAGASSRSRLDAFKAGLSLDLSPSALVPTARTTETVSDLKEVLKEATPADGAVPTASTETAQIDSTKTTLTEAPRSPLAPSEVDLSGFTAIDPGVLAAALDDDPFRRFTAAAALRAQVQLLDAQVRQASELEHVIPYLVQLDVTVNPRRRDLRYDLHSTVSFDLYKVESGQLKGVHGALEIIPLFSNVDFERINLTDLADAIRQANIDLRATIGKFGVGAGAGGGSREQERFVARNFNALTSITRITKQEIDIRTGARWVGDRYQLIAPSQTVIALMLIDTNKTSDPKADSTNAKDVVVKAIARQQLVDGEDGRDLPVGSRANYYAKIARIVDDFNLELNSSGDRTFRCKGNNRIAANEISNINDLGSDAKKNARLVVQKRLADWWLDGDDERVRTTLMCLSDDAAHDIQKIRLELAGLKRSTQYAIDTKRVPPLRGPVLPNDVDFRNQLVYYISNDKGIVARIALPGKARTQGLKATLVLNKLDGSGEANLFAQSVAATDTALTLTFPPIDREKHALSAIKLSGSSSIELKNLFNIPEMPAETRDTSIVLYTGLTALSAHPGGSGSLLLTVNKGKDANEAHALRLTSSGGQITAIEEGVSRGNIGAFELPFGRTYTIELQNLVPGQTLVLIGQALNSKGEEFGKPVEEKLYIMPAMRAGVPHSVTTPN